MTTVVSCAPDPKEGKKGRKKGRGCLKVEGEREGGGKKGRGRGSRKVTGMGKEGRIDREEEKGEQFIIIIFF